VEADKKKSRTRKRKDIATAENESLAEDIADRVNEQAHKEEEDRWSA